MQGTRALSLYKLCSLQPLVIAQSVSFGLTLASDQMKDITQQKFKSAEAEANEVNQKPVPGRTTSHSLRVFGCETCQNSIFISTCTNKACSHSQFNLSVVIATQSKL